MFFVLTQSHELCERGGVGEPGDTEIAGVDRQDRARVLGDGRGVVLDVGAVGGADLDEPRAALAQHVGYPEATTYLDRLAAGHDHVLAAGEGR